MEYAASNGGMAGQTALITGASRGIGRAVARVFARHGARVGISARSAEALDTLARETGGHSLPCDVTDPAAVQRMAQDFEAWAGGPPDVLVCAAGVFSLAPVEDTSDADLERNLAVNLAGSIRVVRALLPAMRARGKGSIVLVGSVAGRQAFPGNAAYSASKFGLRGFHEVLLEELRGSGLRATLLEPASVDTTIWDDIDRSANPGLPERTDMLNVEAVADAVAYVVGRGSRVQIPYLPIETV